MKRVGLVVISIVMLWSCNKIPNKLVYEPLSIKEIATAIKHDNEFADFYESCINATKDFTDVQKAKYNKLTYSRLFNFLNDIESDTNLVILNEKYYKVFDNIIKDEMLSNAEKESRYIVAMESLASQSFEFMKKRDELCANFIKETDW